MNPPRLEDELTRALSQAETPYRRALALLEEADGSDVHAVNRCLDQVQPLLRQIRDLDDRLTLLRRDWLSVPRRPGPVLAGLLRTHEQLLSTLLGRLGQLEQLLQGQRRQLAPVVDDHMRRQQMQRAYQQRGASMS